MKLLFLCATFTVCTFASAQIPDAEIVSRQRHTINRSGLTVLGSWAVLNIGTGFIGQANTSGVQKHFHKTNIVWGGANLLLAGIGFFSERSPSAETLTETYRKQINTEKLFLFNTALDLGYMVFGLYTRERAARFTGAKRDRLTGTGNSFLVQGGFLAIFDGVMYLLHSKNCTHLFQLLQNLSFSPNENGTGLVYRF